MRVAVVGAGFAGLAAARVLQEVGLDVVVYERNADIGGVWSASRHYPGLSTQNDKRTYALSELAMPADYPEFPSGPQVLAYLQSYVDAFGLQPLLRLSHSVTSAEPVPEGGWMLRVRRPDATTTDDRVDHLVVANGVYSQPHRPDWSGSAEFEAAGGVIVAPIDLHDEEQGRDRAVLVVGDGKSASDVAVALSDTTASTTLVARNLRWKIPKRIGGRVPYQYLLLSRLGENLFPYRHLEGVERLLHGVGDPLRRSLILGLRAVIAQQLRLHRLGLLPTGDFTEVASARTALVTDGFYERVERGTLRVLPGRSVARLGAANGQPFAQLSDGTTIPVDVVVAATGYVQQVPFLPPEVQAELTDEHGDFRLYRNVAPLTVPDLTFVGYNQSFFSPLSAETAAIWVAGLLIGHHTLPDSAVREADVSQRLQWSRERTGGHHSHGTNVTPFSMHNIDELLGDLGLNLSPMARAVQWLVPVNPAAYRSRLRRLTTARRGG